MARKQKPESEFWQPDIERISKLSAPEARRVVLQLLSLLFPPDDDLDMGETMQVVEDLCHDLKVLK